MIILTILSLRAVFGVILMEIFHWLVTYNQCNIQNIALVTCAEAKSYRCLDVHPAAKTAITYSKLTIEILEQGGKYV